MAESAVARKGSSVDDNGAPSRSWLQAVRSGGRLETPPGEPRRVGYIYILPAVAVYATFVLVPLGHTVWLSFFSWDGLGPRTWVGLSNYRALLEDPLLRKSFAHSLVLIVFYSLIPVSIGLLLAATLSRAPLRGMTAFRAVLFLPFVLTSVVVGVTWRWIYNPEGPLNTALSAVGLEGLTRAWLGDFGAALPAVGVIGTWVTYGLCMVLFIAGVQKIPATLYEAARVDGAGPVREFFAVTLPGLRNEVVVALTLTIIFALRSFDIIYVTTRGGPGESTSVPALTLYQRAFLTGEVGSAAAVGVALAIMIFAVVFLFTRLAERSAS